MMDRIHHSFSVAPSVCAGLALIAFLSVVGVPEVSAQRASLGAGVPLAKWSASQRDAIADKSRALLGIRYVWAGATPERGMDCTGFVHYVYGQMGVRLPRVPADFMRVGEAVTFDTSTMQIGDLLVFSRRNNPRISHVGMYVGNARMVHASSVRKAVVEVSLSKYSGMQLRSVRRVVAIDSTSNDDAVPRLR